MLPDGFKICHKADADYNDCLNQAATIAIKLLASGDKTLGVSPIDPLDAQHVHIPGNGGSVDLEQTFDNMMVYGFGSSEVSDLKIDMDGKCHIGFTSMTPHLELIGDYKATGKLLVFSLNGHGTFNITSNDMKITHDITCEKFKKKDKEFIKFTDYKLVLDSTKLYYDFKNLIDGNAELSAEVLKVMNDNPLDIFVEVKADYGRTFAEFFKHIGNQLFSKIPADIFFS